MENRNYNKQAAGLLSAAAALCLAVSSAQGALIAHWKLDEANGDYTSGGIREEVSGNSTIAREVSASTSITEGAAGLAPDGGTAMTFTATDPDSYINAGSVESNGTYVSGAATTPLVLGNTFSITAWFNVSSVAGNSDRMIISNTFNSNTGFALGTSGTNIVADFGNLRFGATAGISANRTYFVAMLHDTDGDVNFGWTAGANNRISLYDTTTSTWQHFDGTQSKSVINLQNLTIGSFTSATTREFVGTLDDIRIDSDTLSQAQLNALVIPEPSSALLGGLGLLVLLRRRR